MDHATRQNKTIIGFSKIRILRKFIIPLLLALLLLFTLMLAMASPPSTVEPTVPSDVIAVDSHPPASPTKPIELPWQRPQQPSGPEIDLQSIFGVQSSELCITKEIGAIRNRQQASNKDEGGDDAYDSANEATQLGNLYSSIHCIDGENPDDQTTSLGAESNQKPPRGPFHGPSNIYGFNTVNRSCFFTNVLYQYPQRFTVFLPDTAKNRRLHAKGLLVPPVTLASRPYDGLSFKKRLVAHSYDYRPQVVFGMVPGRADRLSSWLETAIDKKRGDRSTAVSNEVYQFMAVLRTYSDCDATEVPEKYLQAPYIPAEGAETAIAQIKERRASYCRLVKGIADYERAKKGRTSADVNAANSIPTDCSIIAYYTPIVAPWNYAHTLFCDLFGLFWASYDFVFGGAGDATRANVQRWHWHVGGGSDIVADIISQVTAKPQSSADGSSARAVSDDAEVGNDEVIHKFRGGKKQSGIAKGSQPSSSWLSLLLGSVEGSQSATVDGHFSSVTSRRSEHTGLHTIETNPPESERLWQLTQALVRGNRTPQRHAGAVVNNGNEAVGGGASPTDAILDASIPRPDFKIVATSNHYGRSFALPNKNKAFEMFSNYEHTSGKDSATFKGAIYDVSLANNTIYRGLLAGIGTKSWSWVTDSYAASGNPHVWYAFRQHVFEVTGAVPLGWPPPIPKGSSSDVAIKAAPTTQQPAEAIRDPNALRISICHKKDKRGVVNYEETLHSLEAHFAPLLEGSSAKDKFDMTFVLEAAVGKTAEKQVEMMDRADIFMCNEGTLATSFFLMGPGSVFISLPLVYHMANLHRMQMPPAEEWWKEPDLLRPDPRKNTGGNIDWFPQAIPWVRTFWYDHVPLNETKIQTPLKGLRNYMPEWNIVVEKEKIARLYEKVLGYLVSQGHPKAEKLGQMLNSINPSSSNDRKGQLLQSIKYWRDVFEERKVLQSDKKSGGGTEDQHKQALTYMRPRHPLTTKPSNQKHDGADDDEHNFSVNARLCKGILAATPGWSVAFNGVKCLYGMSWLCEFWTNTRFQSRRLHPKWDKSGGKCGDLRTTVPEASRILKEKEAGVGTDLFDPRTGFSSNTNAPLNVLLTEASDTVKGFMTSSFNVDDFFRLSEADQRAILNFAASSPFLFSSTSDFPRALSSYLFYDPAKVRSVYKTTDIRLTPIEHEELVAIFGKDALGKAG